MRNRGADGSAAINRGEIKLMPFPYLFSTPVFCICFTFNLLLFLVIDVYLLSTDNTWQDRV